MRWNFVERFMVRAMCGVQPKVRKRAKDLILLLGLRERDTSI